MADESKRSVLVGEERTYKIRLRWAVLRPRLVVEPCDMCETTYGWGVAVCVCGNDWRTAPPAGAREGC